MSVRVTTLSSGGFLADPDLKIDYLMCAFFFSKHSQSTLYRGSISSLGKLIQQYGNDPHQIRQNLEDKLRDLLAKYFTTVSVNVSLEATEPDIKLLLEGIVSDGDSLSLNSISIGYSLIARDSEVKRIVNALNGSVVYPI